MEVGSAASSYEILAKLAEGGMAEIFLARSVTGAGIERIVVLKRVLPDRARDPHFVEQFVNEARLAAQLQHANVVQVYDVGKLGSSYFFSMEYVHGETVRDLMLYARQQRIRIPVSTVLTIAAGAAAGLHHAHDRRNIHGKSLGIVHSDVSPTNIMITRDGIVKIVDFGIAKAELHSGDSEGTLRGKVCYMSPEQVHSQKLDRRSDLFSLGIVLWELLTLQGLFRGDSDFEVMQAVESGEPAPPSTYRSDVPREVDELIMRLLAKQPVRRFQSAAELLDGIEAAAVRLNTLLSMASLARQLREWFGVKPEPWIEESTNGSSSRLVVNAEPVPKGYAQTIAGPIDQILETLSSSSAHGEPVEGMSEWDWPSRSGTEWRRDRSVIEPGRQVMPQPAPAVVPTLPRAGIGFGPTEPQHAVTPASEPAPRPSRVTLPRPRTQTGSARRTLPVQRKSSALRWIILGIVIMLATGAAAFGLLLWQTRHDATGSLPRDAAATILDANATVDTPSQADAGMIDAASVPADAKGPPRRPKR